MGATDISKEQCAGLNPSPPLDNPFYLLLWQHFSDKNKNKTMWQSDFVIFRRLKQLK